MLLETLNALIRAGEDALQAGCGLTVSAHGISLLRQGSLTFPAVAEVTVRNGPLQKVHLGCDASLRECLASRPDSDGGQSAVAALADQFVSRLLDDMDARNPRGDVRHPDAVPTTLISRGRRTFGVRLETEAGQFFVLSELPSRMELELAKGGEYLPAMASAYLPANWESSKTVESKSAIENLLVFLRKVEADVVFEVPGADGVSRVHAGLLLEDGTWRGVRGLKFSSDRVLAGAGGLVPDTQVLATVGVGERSLQFVMRYLGPTVHPLANGAELPAAIFQPPETVAIAQRRLAFRIPVRDEIPARLVPEIGQSSPWGDAAADEAPLFAGVLDDLSFGGARLVAAETPDQPCLELNRRVRCEIDFEDLDAPLSVLAVVRRTTSRLVNRNDRRFEIGLEFLIGQDADRAALDFIRDFVLAEQRARLAQRIQLTTV